MFRQFRKNVFYLALYQRRLALLLIITNLILIFKIQVDWFDGLLFLPAIVMLSSLRIQWNIAGAAVGAAATAIAPGFDPVYLLAIPGAVIFGFICSGLIHCASHESIRPRWLNRPIGELMGVVQLNGFADWTIVHLLHHMNTDDPELDPHAPGSKRYWEYTKSMRESIPHVFKKHYFRLFQESPESIRALRVYGRASRLANLNKVILFYLILGPQLFVFFFAISVLAKNLQFSWLNWAAHRPGPNGVEIRNLDDFPHKIANFFSFGLYFHGNHHLAPALFNPSRFQPQRDLAQKE